LLELEDDGVLCDGCASKVVTHVYERRERASDETLDALESRCWRVSISVEEKRVVWLVGGEFARKGQDIVVVIRMRFWGMWREKVESEGIDDEEDGTFVSGW
jgi:hypothetical protein